MLITLLKTSCFLSMAIILKTFLKEMFQIYHPKLHPTNISSIKVNCLELSCKCYGPGTNSGPSAYFHLLGPKYIKKDNEIYDSSSSEDAILKFYKKRKNWRFRLPTRIDIRYL